MTRGCIDKISGRRYVNAMARNDTPRSFRFQPEEVELLDRVAKGYPSAKAAVIAGLKALEKAQPITNAELLKLLKERLK
jgi:hypothetical protein